MGSRRPVRKPPGCCRVADKGCGSKLASELPLWLTIRTSTSPQLYQVYHTTALLLLLILLEEAETPKNRRKVQLHTSLSSERHGKADSYILLDFTLNVSTIILPWRRER